MKTILWISIFFALFLQISCSTAKIINDDYVMEKANEAIIFCRIQNNYFEPLNIELVSMDFIKIYCFYDVEKNESIIVAPIKKGRYNINMINGIKFPSQIIEIEPDKINYIGDISIDGMDINSPLMITPLSQFQYEIKDNALDAEEQFKSQFPILYNNYEFINSTNETNDFHRTSMFIDPAQIQLGDKK